MNLGSTCPTWSLPVTKGVPEGICWFPVRVIYQTKHKKRGRGPSPQSSLCEAWQTDSVRTLFPTSEVLLESAEGGKENFGSHKGKVRG